MKICVCDKCGKQFNMPTPTQNAKVPVYKISKLNSLMFPAWGMLTCVVTAKKTLLNGWKVIKMNINPNWMIRYYTYATPVIGMWRELYI